MVIAALACFAILLCAWAVAPGDGRRQPAADVVDPMPIPEPDTIPIAA